jgi:hypothetical protein
LPSLHGCSLLSSWAIPLYKDFSPSVAPSNALIFMKIREILLLSRRSEDLLGILFRSDTLQGSSNENWLRDWKLTPSLIL